MNEITVAFERTSTGSISFDAWDLYCLRPDSVALEQMIREAKAMGVEYGYVQVAKKILQ